VIRRLAVVGWLVLGGLLGGCGATPVPVASEARDWILPSPVPAAKPAKAEVGYPAPPVELPDIAGQRVSLSDFQGRIVLLNFWALWCDPCKAEMPDFQAAQTQYGPQGFDVVTVNLGDQVHKVEAFVEAGGYTFTTLLDTSLDVGQVYNAKILPKTLLIDRQGVIRYTRLAPFDPGELEAEVQTLLSEGP
jgi:peroxiredoxin